LDRRTHALSVGTEAGRWISERQAGLSSGPIDGKWREKHAIELGEHVGGALADARSAPELDEATAPLLAPRRMGHDEERTFVLARPSCGVPRAAPEARFDHDHHVRQGNEASVPGEERGLRRRRGVRHERDVAAALANDAFEELSVLFRKRTAPARRSNCDRDSTGTKSPLVRRRVDSNGTTREDGHAGASQGMGKPIRKSRSPARRIARSDDCDARPARQFAPQVEHGRRVLQIRETMGER
jgi:hypothetical protein